MSLLENIILKRQKINFDLSKSLNENLNVLSQDLATANVPLKPKQAEWEEQDGYLCCNFNFNIMPHVSYFLNLILEKAHRIQHRPKIKIEGLNVHIALQTKDLQHITEADLDFAKFIDEVYDDIKFIRDF